MYPNRRGGMHTYASNREGYAGRNNFGGRDKGGFGGNKMNSQKDSFTNPSFKRGGHVGPMAVQQPMKSELVKQSDCEVRMQEEQQPQRNNRHGQPKMDIQLKANPEVSVGKEASIKNVPVVEMSGFGGKRDNGNIGIVAVANANNIPPVSIGVAENNDNLNPDQVAVKNVIEDLIEGKNDGKAARLNNNRGMMPPVAINKKELPATGVPTCPNCAAALAYNRAMMKFLRDIGQAFLELQAHVQPSPDPAQH